MRKLKENLGKVLFKRLARGVELTGKGESLSIWGFGWKSTATTGILKNQSRKNMGISICGIGHFFRFDFLIQLYNPQPLSQANPSL